MGTHNNIIPNVGGGKLSVDPEKNIFSVSPDQKVAYISLENGLSNLGSMFVRSVAIGFAAEIPESSLDYLGVGMAYQALFYFEIDESEKTLGWSYFVFQGWASNS